MSSLMDKETFNELVKSFIAISTLLNDDWQIKTIKISEHDDTYIEKKFIIPGSDDPIKTDFNSFSTFVFHVIYSFSYCVPVLYFNAYHNDGKPLTLDEIWMKVPNCYEDTITLNKWSTITQQEHPKLGYPCFMLHPCKTADMMSNVCGKTKNYIITWLSTVGPVVGLKLSPEYASYIKD